ncbi:MAG: nicotinic acid mononucleotide adenyltransferase [Bacteroidetes bacterium]|nr:nicotinic acid mononucleotide adenyltransferase [Bacteroidota bacterium]
MSCKYKKNKQDGKFLAYHKNGKKKIEGNYYNGNLDGNWKSYNEKGHIISDEKYNFGKKIGTWYYYFENGIKKAEVVYKDGLIKENKEWNESGKLVNSFFAD